MMDNGASLLCPGSDEEKSPVTMDGLETWPLMGEWEVRHADVGPRGLSGVSG